MGTTVRSGSFLVPLPKHFPQPHTTYTTYWAPYPIFMRTLRNTGVTVRGAQWTPYRSPPQSITGTHIETNEIEKNLRSHSHLISDLQINLIVLFLVCWRKPDWLIQWFKNVWGPVRNTQGSVWSLLWCVFFWCFFFPWQKTVTSAHFPQPPPPSYHHQETSAQNQSLLDPPSMSLTLSASLKVYTHTRTLTLPNPHPGPKINHSYIHYPTLTQHLKFTNQINAIPCPIA